MSRLHAISQALGDVRSHMREELPREAVGLIWDDATTSELVNTGSDGEFKVTDEDLAQAVKEVSGDRELIAVYHSHPQGSIHPSLTDVNSMREQFSNGSTVPWLIVTEDSNSLWTLSPTFQSPIRILLPTPAPSHA